MRLLKSGCCGLFEKGYPFYPVWGLSSFSSAYFHKLLARSSYNYPGMGKDETAIKVAIEQLAGEWPTYGYGRITKQLHRQGTCINSKRVRRLIGELNLLQLRKGQNPPPTTTRSEHSFQRYPYLVNSNSRRFRKDKIIAEFS